MNIILIPKIVLKFKQKHLILIKRVGFDPKPVSRLPLPSAPRPLQQPHVASCPQVVKDDRRHHQALLSSTSSSALPSLTTSLLSTTTSEEWLIPYQVHRRGPLSRSSVQRAYPHHIPWPRCHKGGLRQHHHHHRHHRHQQHPWHQCQQHHHHHHEPGHLGRRVRVSQCLPMVTEVSQSSSTSQPVWHRSPRFCMMMIFSNIACQNHPLSYSSKEISTARNKDFFAPQHTFQ